MEDQSSTQSPASGPRENQSVSQAMRALIANLARIFGGLKRWLTSGAGILAWVFALAFGTGGAAGFFIPGMHSTSSSEISLGAAEIGAPALVTSGDLKTPLLAGFIRGATITGMGTKNVPTPRNLEDFSKHTQSEYRVSVEFPKPDPCYTDCKSAMVSLVGEEWESTCRAQCKTTLKNVDQVGGKDNSTDVRDDCTEYQENKQKVEIMFSGRRDRGTSNYANILLVTAVS